MRRECISLLGLMGLFFSSLITLPAQAQLESQLSQQDVVIDGDNNQVTQIINQTIINRPGQGHARWLKAKIKHKLGRPDGNSKPKAQKSDN